VKEDSIGNSTRQEFLLKIQTKILEINIDNALYIYECY